MRCMLQGLLGLHNRSSTFRQGCGLHRRVAVSKLQQGKPLHFLT